ncbi:amidohydrolase family protein [Nocardioides sp. YIM 152315]|uniref:metal-dependent hydrolase family protein n=1 Tax=Nocardioides sp. YIM 152315 TaxID=3031760 RepID=UPI0023DAA813|nr:amidohydrolase family protein [Nocardioides sp. YIM 152315]MDF1604526.1 amidohydrolase family protein [Nocardioides sp. YIM 152315]
MDPVMDMDQTTVSTRIVRLSGARLIDGTGAGPVEGLTLLIRDGRFAYVGPAEGCPDVEVDDDIDLGGRTVLPGFFDVHVHFLMDNNGDFRNRLLSNFPTVTVFERAQRMRETLHAGVTTVRDLGGIDAGYREAISRGLIEGPRLQVAVRLMSHTGGHADFRLPSGFDPCAILEPFNELADTPDEARLATRRLLRDQADVIKICASGGVNSPSDQPEDEGMTVEEIAAVVEETRRHRGVPVAAHAQGTQGIKNAVRGGVTSIEHGYLLDDEAIDLMVERGTFLVPTLSTFHAPGQDFAASAAAKKQRLLDVAMERLSEAVRRDVKVALGTDSGVGAHGHNLAELAHLTDIGLSPLAAITAGTRTAAELMRMDADFGSVEVGKVADLVVCQGDPIDDIGLLADAANVLLVMQGGQVVKDSMPAAIG